MEEIKKEVPTTTIAISYKAADGKEFSDRNACIQYENELKLNELKRKFGYGVTVDEQGWIKERFFIYKEEYKDDFPIFLHLLVSNANNFQSLHRFGNSADKDYNSRNILKTLKDQISEWKDGEKYFIDISTYENSDDYDDLDISIESKESYLNELVKTTKELIKDYGPEFLDLLLERLKELK